MVKNETASCVQEDWISYIVNNRTHCRINRLYHDSGFDCIEKLANTNGEELIRVTKEFIERTGFEGIPAKKTANTIKSAKRLSILLEL